MSKYIAIIDYKINNLFSISNILNNIGFKNIITNDKKLIDNSYAIILPGVGSFPNAMENLDKLGLIEIIKENAVNDKIIIGICLGFQLLFSKSSEIQGSEGLNILSGEVKDLTHEKTDKVIPHVGWNQVFLSRSNCEKNFLNEEYYYFVHSFYVVPENKKIIYTTTNYGNFNFCSSVKFKNIYGFQFHPEKSGKMVFICLKQF